MLETACLCGALEPPSGGPPSTRDGRQGGTFGILGMRTGTGGNGETVEFVDTTNEEGLVPRALVELGNWS